MTPTADKDKAEQLQHRLNSYNADERNTLPLSRTKEPTRGTVEWLPG